MLLRPPGRRFRRAPPHLPAWLAHPLRWQRLPVPWAAVARGALAAGPLLGAGTAAGRPTAGVLAGLGAMLAGVNDRPGTRRTGIVHVGLPALAATFGLLLGGTAVELTGGGWWALPVLLAVGTVSGAVSVIGPVSSTAGMQLLVTVIIGMGMPLPGPAWQKALWFLCGAGWLLLLRLVLRPPRSAAAGRSPDGERAVLAAVFDALADALAAVGGPGAVPARRRLTAALDRADEAMRLRRLLRHRRTTDGERLLAERFAAATALCEAAVALLWEAHPLPPRVSDGPRRLAAAIRTGALPGALPAPEGSTAARAAFDRALLDAAVVFGRTAPGDAGGPPQPSKPPDTRDPSDPRDAPSPRSPTDPAAPPGPTCPGPPGPDGPTAPDGEREPDPGPRSVPPATGPPRSPVAAARRRWPSLPQRPRRAGRPRLAASGAEQAPPGDPVRTEAGPVPAVSGTRPVTTASGRHRTARRAAATPRRTAVRRARRSAFGAAGREYGIRVAVCVVASAAVALALRANHWYWLPATAAFLVKPDMGPLFSRVVNRFAGTVVGVLVFAAVAAVPAALPVGGWWPPVVAAVAGALVPVATRHFALQTAVITVLVLAFVSAAGDTQAAGTRLIDTAIACGIVLLVGHLPRLVDPAPRVGSRLSVALRRTEAYLHHVLGVPPGERVAERRELRRAAYRALGEARAAAETAAAELPARRGPVADWVPVVAAAERIVDAATACAVRMEHGAVPPGEAETAQVTGALLAVAEAIEGRGGGPLPDLVTSSECATLTDVVAELHRIREATA